MAYSHDGTDHPTPTQAPRVTHRALCPTCGRFAERETHKQGITGIRVSVYHCEAAHLWKTIWPEGD